MNKDIIKGKWKEIKGKIKEQWGEISDDEVTKINGSYDQLEGILQQRYGYKKEEAEKHISSFIHSNKWNE